MHYSANRIVVSNVFVGFLYRCCLGIRTLVLRMPIPLPEVFQHTHSWTYGCPYVSPSLGSDSIVPQELMDPDVIFVRPPDKIHVFKTPGHMEYIPVPHMPPDPSDPTGMRQMMEFLGFKKDHVDIATSSVVGASSSNTGNAPASAGTTPGPSPSSNNVQQASTTNTSAQGNMPGPAMTSQPPANPTNPNSGLIRYY